MQVKREEHIGRAVLYHAESEGLIPNVTGFDAIVTDPPYGLGKKMSGGTWGANQKYKDMPEWDGEAKQEWIDAMLARRVPTIIFGGNYFTMPPARCWLSWCKPDFPTMADFELAWTNLDRPAKRFVSMRTPPGGKEHPTQKPVALMKWCLNFLSRTPPLPPNDIRSVHGFRFDRSRRASDGAFVHRNRKRRTIFFPGVRTHCGRAGSPVFRKNG